MTERSETTKELKEFHTKYCDNIRLTDYIRCVRDLTHNFVAVVRAQILKVS